MSRLIDADELLNIADETALAWEYRRIVSDIRNIIGNAPTINPEDLRPRGRWEKHRTMHGFVYCSNCKDVYLDEEWLVDGKWGFCPNCGAKMEDEK